MSTLHLRIIHTHDTEANWNLCTEFIPRCGEVIVYDVDESHAYPRFKMGDGIQNIINLPFTVDIAFQSLLNIQNNVVHLDAGRITDYVQELPDNDEASAVV